MAVHPLPVVDGGGLKALAQHQRAPRDLVRDVVAVLHHRGEDVGALAGVEMDDPLLSHAGRPWQEGLEGC